MRFRVTKFPRSFPLLGQRGDWDEGYPGGATVWKEGDTYMMWYAAGRKPPQQTHAPGFVGVQWGCGLAFSKDLFHWTTFEGNPVFNSGPPGSWDSGFVRMETVTKIGGTFPMWYHGEASGIGVSMGYATSKDGIRWQKHLPNPVLRRVRGEWDGEVAGDGTGSSFNGKFYLCSE